MDDCSAAERRMKYLLGFAHVVKTGRSSIKLLFVDKCTDKLLMMPALCKIWLWISK
ncbi:hypothetical protein KIN20_003815 [Parelaphostrongylus tenuis]|uniref:Uncharacterized protein n=1 Tax=Parelaphostrongylus tenuis TaxID=148309 RepID=A0AAD5MGB0_PARTN|nr:hypothetical protein KIN20_003815 [Parelaphostrongylus tenuis]